MRSVVYAIEIVKMSRKTKCAERSGTNDKKGAKSPYKGIGWRQYVEWGQDVAHLSFLFHLDIWRGDVICQGGRAISGPSPIHLPRRLMKMAGPYPSYPLGWIFLPPLLRQSVVPSDISTCVLSDVDNTTFHKWLYNDSSWDNAW